MGRKNKKCADCGTLIWSESTHCLSCARKGERNHRYKHGNCSRVLSPCLDCGEGMTEGIRCWDCSYIHRSGENNPRWKGGRAHHTNGYTSLLTRDHPNADVRGYVLEHRLVMEKKIGRYLTKEENVHHMNGVKDDNRIENLELWTKPQPTGVRVSDEIERCIKFLAKYNIKVAYEEISNNNNTSSDEDI